MLNLIRLLQLCFFLVDDTDPSDELDFPGFKYVGLESNYVLTTSEVPSQERACNLPTLELLLPVAVRQLTHGHRNLPPEIVEVILAEAVKDDGLGLSRAEAEKRRRELMKDRKVNAEEIDGVSSSKPLCVGTVADTPTAVAGRILAL
jgi:hypothetical protein